MALPIDMAHDDVANVADPAQVEAATLVNEQGQLKVLNDVRAVMSSREGRRAVRRWLGLHGLYESVTRIDSSALTYALSGRRDAGLEMLRDLVTADGTSFLAMETEHREDEAHRREIEAAMVRRAAGREASSYDDLDTAA